MAPDYPTPPSSPLAVQSPRTSKRYTEHLSLHDKASRTNPAADATSPIRTPSNASHVTNHGQQATIYPSLDPDMLKSLFNINDWRCSSPTKQGKPCAKWVSKVKRPKIQSTIETIANLHHSSPELRNKLQHLAELVQCHCHGKAYAINLRVAKWLVVFRTAERDDDPAIYLKREIKKALGLDSMPRPKSEAFTRCIGEIITQKDCSLRSIEQEQCPMEVGGQKVHNSIRTIDRIIDVAQSGDDREIEYLVQVLERNRQCQDHNESTLKHTHAWYSDILKIQGRYRASMRKLADTSTAKVSRRPQGCSCVENDQGALCAHEANNSQKYGDPASNDAQPTWLNVDPAKYWPTAYDVSPFDIVERKPKTRQSLEQELIKTAGSVWEVKAGDLTDGYVYLYQVPGNEKYVKIGYTTRDVVSRQKEWQFSCNREADFLYPKLLAVRKVRHARRVEALCHKELDSVRICIYCRACLQEHVEWFEITPVDALEVIQKWSKWMATDPYEGRVLRSVTKWVLRDDQEKRILDLVRN
ncbi:DNA-binding protein [Metarhizium rileyi]|uniref:DNA-binding protein n=1 Tax=Metarhizium rileyi (strain RCEF 4871) TaxID=1649241 RepID=A0A166ZWT8_METRR|nr:DNA-binding protein [Metarhizium rileyi RCEF 4871]